LEKQLWARSTLFSNKSYRLQDKPEILSRLSLQLMSSFLIHTRLRFCWQEEQHNCSVIGKRQATRLSLIQQLEIFPSFVKGLSCSAWSRLFPL